MDITALVLTGAVTALGIGYFCVDLYRNRSKRLSHFEVIADATGVEPKDFQIGNEVAHHSAHGVSEASHRVTEGLGKYIEAIAHTLSHH